MRLQQGVVFYDILEHMEKTHPELSPEDRALLQGYLARQAIFPGNTPRLFAIGFLGLPGSGKSTLADMIGDDFNLPVNRSDQIRRYLNDHGFPGPDPRPDIMASLAEARTTYYYENDTSAVIDANFTEYAESSRKNARTFGAVLLLVGIACPDEVAVERLKERSKNMTMSDSTVMADGYARRKIHYAKFPPVKDPYFTVDSTEPLEPQVQNLREQMESEGYLAVK
jgi:adenylate kinase family enzyme